MAAITVPNASMLHIETVPWMGEQASIAMKLLRVDPVGGEYTLYTRMDAGTQLPRHRHFGPVDAWTIKGTWRYLEYDWVAGPGGYVHEPPGATHTLRVGDGSEVVVLFVVRGGLVLLDDNDQIWGYEDWESMRDRYIAAVTADGHPVPTFLP